MRELLERLSELASVEPARLVDTSAGEARARLLRAHLGELRRTLAEAQVELAALEAVILRGAEGQGRIEVRTARDAGEGTEVSGLQDPSDLRERATAARNYAALADLTADLLPRLAAVSRLTA